MFTIAPIHEDRLLGAEIRGIDLRQAQSDETIRALEAALARHAVLVIPRQEMSDDEHIAFSRRFGPLERRNNYARSRERIPSEVLNDISNIDVDGKLLEENDRQRMMNLGNTLWHTDGTFKHVPSMISMLYAREVPPSGGETEFADMRAAYDALPQARHDELENLIVEHSIFHSRGQIGFSEFNSEIFDKLPPVRQVMIRTHPISGRKSLYLAAHASHVIGWPIERGRALLRELMEFATQPQFTYAHRWRVGDLVIWDNRCTMHRGRPYDDRKHRRVMQRTTVQDVGNTVEQRERAAEPSAPLAAASQ